MYNHPHRYKTNIQYTYIMFTNGYINVYVLNKSFFMLTGWMALLKYIDARQRVLHIFCIRQEITAELYSVLFYFIISLCSFFFSSFAGCYIGERKKKTKSTLFDDDEFMLLSNNLYFALCNRHALHNHFL